MSDRLDEIRRISREEGHPVILEEGFLILVDEVQKRQPKKILEIGTATGCSAIAMLNASKGSRVTTIEIDEDTAEKARKNFIEFDLQDRVTQFIGDANEIIPSLTGQYDFIFEDGPKGHYFEHLPYYAELLKVGGVLFADNVAFHGFVNSEKKCKRVNTIVKSMRNFIDGIQKDDRFITTILDKGDGILIAERIK